MSTELSKVKNSGKARTIIVGKADQETTICRALNPNSIGSLA